jgi:hypothetical protein
LSRAAKGALLGLTYGSVLWLLGLAVTGMGHGTYFPMFLFAAPLSLIPVAGLFAAPIWWALIGRVLGQRRRVPAIGLMGMHFVAAILVLWLGTPFESGADRWEYFGKMEELMPRVVWGGIGLYVLGQIVAWWVVFAATEVEDPFHHNLAG